MVSNKVNLFLMSILVSFSLALPANAGRVEGPGKVEDSVDPNKDNIHPVNLKGGEDVYIVVKGDGASDIDCFLFDEFRKMLDSDMNPSDRCDLHAKIPVPGKHLLLIYNAGKNTTKYVAKTN